MRRRALFNKQYEVLLISTLSVGVGQGSPVLRVIIFASYWAAPAP
jgi:hypothetical protein